MKQKSSGLLSVPDYTGNLPHFALVGMTDDLSFYFMHPVWREYGFDEFDDHNDPTGTFRLLDILDESVQIRLNVVLGGRGY